MGRKELEKLSFEGTVLTLPGGRVAEPSDLNEADFYISIYAGKWGTTKNPMKHGFAGTFGGKSVYVKIYWKYVDKEGD